MAVERAELATDDSTFVVELERPPGGSEHGALLVPGGNHTSFDDAVFDRLAEAAADAGIEFLRYQTWDDYEELAAKSQSERAAEIDAALDFLAERGCTRISLVGKSVGGAMALRIAPTAVDEMVLWAPGIFLEGGDTLAGLDVPSDADPATITAAELGAVTVPVAVLQGDEDAIPVGNAHELTGEIPTASVHVIGGADHSFIGGESEAAVVGTTIELLSTASEEW